MDSFLGYHNLLDSGTVTASSEAAGFEKENAYDGFTFDFWQPGSVTAYLNHDAGSLVTSDYFALGAHDLFTQGATIGLEYADDSGYSVNLTDAFTPITPTDNSPIFRAYTQINKQYRRTKITGSIASLGVVMFGDRLALPNGVASPFKLITEAREGKLLNSISESGQFIGRSVIRQGMKGKLPLNSLDPAWVRANWPALSAHMETKPFFLQWDNTNYEDETALIWLNKAPPTPAYTSVNYMAVTLDFSGQVR